MKSFSPISSVLAVLSLAALASLMNAACSAPTELDAGTNESAQTSRGPYGYGGSYSGSYGGYYGARDLADDNSF
jgi:hypothetical protein